MSKKRNLQPNSELNFVLKGFNSIQIGIYFLIFGYVTKAFFEGFLSDSSLLGMMSIEIIEMIVSILAVLFAVFSYFALFFSSRRSSRKKEIQLWNPVTKATFSVTFLLSAIVLFALSYLYQQGFFLDITAVFLLLYGVYLLLYNFRKKTEMYLIGIICLSLAVVCFVIPTYWYSSLLIVGISHVVYGIAVRN